GPGRRGGPGRFRLRLPHDLVAPAVARPRAGARVERPGVRRAPAAREVGVRSTSPGRGRRRGRPRWRRRGGERPPGYRRTDVRGARAHAGRVLPTARGPGPGEERQEAKCSTT